MDQFNYERREQVPQSNFQALATYMIVLITTVGWHAQRDAGSMEWQVS
jgi:hypothetical protein